MHNDIWIIAGSLAVAVPLCASLVLWLRNRGSFFVRSAIALRRKSPLEFAIVALIVGGVIHHGSTKTNNIDRCIGYIAEEDMHCSRKDASVLSQETEGREDETRLRSSVGDHLFFSLIAPRTNGMDLAIVLPTNGVTNNLLDLFCGLELKGEWALLGQIEINHAMATASVFVAMSELPNSPTNMPNMAFFDVGILCDDDNDGIYDGREIRLLGTSPQRWDTDGDGLSDGEEVAMGTAPLLRDTDGDGFPDDEELLASTDPLVANVGATLTIRYVYDDDDYLVATYVGEGGGASLTTWSPSGNPNSTSERMTGE